ncbi:peptidase C26 [Megasphaera vaginalis (ex Srinivasan et al. 2021)]|uniref:Peptidase C26 n=2 Tax=Megasphaera vaginalis (ex Srinivasan et al. 2021) TaxID=1111454 RepID=U7UHA2_9FIRM|nr:peptidase C26 [Megasphaera vaginalis (ex Srinivasan et al. 2021)]
MVESFKNHAIFLAERTDIEMTRPIIGVSGSCWADTYGNRLSYADEAYLQALTDNGATPIILPYTMNGEAAVGAMSHIDGLLLTGGHDLYPLNYGEEPLPKIGALWPERDQFDLLLLRTAEEHALPIMGICRGMQVINVCYGGTLWQDLSYDESCCLKHDQDDKENPALPLHTITIEADSRLAKIIKKTEWITNSRHHQAVKTVGNRLRAVAKTKDGIIEALEGIDFPYLAAYQFHPEDMAKQNYFAKLLFRDFINACSGGIYQQ